MRVFPGSARRSSLSSQPTSHLLLFLRRTSANAPATPCPPEEIPSWDFNNLSCHPSYEVSSFPHKGFSLISREIDVKTLHGICLKGLVSFGVFHGNTLLNMYAKFGRISYARKVFDGMSDRNEATWNTMMSGYVRNREYLSAVGFFREMCGGGERPDGFLIASLATACDKSGSMFGEGLQVHCFVIKAGLVGDVFVGTSILHFYGSYGLVSESCTIFEEMPERNVVTWTSLMVGLSDNGELDIVIDMYKRMRKDGVSCNENTIALLLKSCGVLGDEWLGSQILGHVVKSGLEGNVSVGNALIGMYGSFGNIVEACRVFHHMGERDIVSWNSIISANAQNGVFEDSLRYFQWMKRIHKEVNSTTLSTLLTICGSSGNVEWGEGIHGLVMKLGLESNACLGNTLLNMYSDSGKLEEAESVFRSMPEKDAISWNSMVACFAQNEESGKAIKLFTEIFGKKKMSFVTITSALTACSNTEFIAEGKILHALAILSGLKANLVVGNALVSMYGKSSMTSEARKVSELMPERDEVTWNALIGCQAENEEPNEALKSFNAMRREGIWENYITVVNLVGGFSKVDGLRIHGMPIHAHLVQNGLDFDKYVQTSLIMMYAKCNDLSSSNLVFERLSTKHSITWNAIIAANAHHSCGEEALKLVSKMREASLPLDQFSLSVALSVSANLAILEEGKQIHGVLVKLGFESEHYVSNAAMDMYGKCGEMDDVLKMFPSSPLTRSRLSWNILISSFAKHGRFDEAKESFHEMLRDKEKPDHVTFVSLLSACSHGGLVDDGLRFYTLMTAEFGVPAAIEHCVCMIDLLGRSGRLSEAEEFIDSMTVEPNHLVWRSLLASCKIHRNVELAKKAMDKLLEIDPTDDSAYVLYSNVCAASGRWEDVELVRARMGTEKIRKQPACSWVKLRNQISKFGMGDKTHPRAAEIYAKLEDLRKLIIESGYVADTSFALHDTDEEQKEQNLWNHSERIALAFALITAPEDSPIRVFKNLRVCGDCHSVYKFVSAIVRRKIVLRDPFRFHHFSDGKCSCCDYW